MKKTESQRVMEYRRRKTKEGFRNIAFMVSPEEYAEIENERKRLGLNTKELFFYYLHQLVLDEGGYHYGYTADSHDMEIIDSVPYTREGYLQLLKTEEKYGEVFQLPTHGRQKKYQEFVIGEFLYHPNKKRSPYFPYALSCPNKGYATYQDALQAYVDRQPKLHKNRQHVLLKKREFHKHEHTKELHDWYIPVFMFNDVHPNLFALHLYNEAPYQVFWESLKAKFEVN